MLHDGIAVDIDRLNWRIEFDLKEEDAVVRREVGEAVNLVGLLLRLGLGPKIKEPTTM